MAAGRGTRLGADRPKALVPLGHGSDAAPLVTHALRGVLSCPDLSDVVVVAPSDRMPELTAAVDLTGVDLTSAGAGQARVTVVAGGAERSDSVAAGLAALPPGVGIVLVHDAARALTPPAVFERVVEAVRHGHSAVVPALPVTDTIKMVDARDHVVSTPDRNALRAVQTPQGFLRETLERAHHEAGGSVTDDAGLVESLGDAVFVVAGDPRSRKITDAEDLAVVESWLSTTPAQGATPVLLVLGGLPGTGKTTLARAWALSRRAAHVRVDTIEVALQRAGADQVGPQGYAAAYALAADQLALGLDVVADSVNPLPVTRAAWREVASASGATVLEVELTCAATEHRERVEGRTADIVGHQVPDWSGVQAADYVPWTDADVALDTTDVDVSDLLAHVEQALQIEGSARAIP
ncbi:2-C-methyl-D-erythritol 4-phosphate cytidylyltransferase [Ornithinimicrobium faecis]|uniref:2-C-methyl-D-erythritol 4-phosphate cytidylyltransferase n=1 Tax=Ornithinimicrobium faecis TaxID=2934158 RepID=UPI0021180878|nr:2-C-methyl-D-erythritol 4-phosphate cytidylyltransferase [Ornithinimicrobium sp. HY1745]